MLDKLDHYKAALCLSIGIVLTNFVGWGLVASRSPQSVTSIILVCAVPLVIPVGLWLGSNLIRYLGAAWMVFWAAALLWPIISNGVTLPASRRGYFIALLLFFIFSAMLNLLTAGILLLSKKFATEFADKRKHQPKYKM